MALHGQVPPPGDAPARAGDGPAGDRAGHHAQELVDREFIDGLRQNVTPVGPWMVTTPARAKIALHRIDGSDVPVNIFG